VYNSIMNSCISVDNLTIRYGQTDVITHASFSVKSGDFVGIIGPNGAGKTTLIKSLLGLVPISEGTISLYGQSFKAFSQWEKINYLPQNLKTLNPLFPATVEEIVFLGLLSSKKLPHRFSLDDKTKVHTVLEKLGIANLKHTVIQKLSGGQQQKVMIARSLVSEPEILIMDEPTTALDPSSRDTFMQLLRALHTTQHATILLVTHDTNLVCQYADKLMYVDKTIIYYGDTETFYNSTAINEPLGAYGKHIKDHHT
jgi:zinc transport system ATP-binding protein